MTKVLFVCTQNTARSVMAEMILKKYGGECFSVSSAGLFSVGYSPMTPCARQILTEEGLGGIFLGDFYSKPVREEEVALSDIVVGVTPSHAQALKERFPEYAGKITTFPRSVGDLWEDEESYRQCFAMLKENILEMFSLSDGSVTVRDMDESGASQSAALEEECFSHPWPLEEYEKARVRDDFICLCAYHDYEYAGFLMAYHVLDEGHLLDIATRPKFRKRGIATALIRELVARLSSIGVKTVMLEAREKNVPARSLYEKLGFRAVGKRLDYYADPRDDAVLYTLDLAEKEEK